MLLLGINWIQSIIQNTKKLSKEMPAFGLTVLTAGSND